MKTSEQLFTEIFWRTTKRFTDIEIFRYRIKQSLPITKNSIEEETLRFAHSLAFENKYDDIITDKNTLFKSHLPFTEITSQMIKLGLNSYQASIDASSIILGHSALDCAAIDYCRVIGLFAPNDWEYSIQNKNYSEILHEKIEKYLQELAFKSLLAKIDKLFELCQPPANFSPIFNYKYDRNRIVAIDELRHKIVHAEGLSVPLITCDDDIKYLMNSASFLLGLLNFKYNLKINSKYLIPVYSADNR